MMEIRWLKSQLHLRDSVTRIPFRYGSACMTECPQATLAVDLEIGGEIVRGYSGDCLPPSWFDKSPGKSFEIQLDEMLASISQACHEFADRFRSSFPFFEGWLQAYHEQHRKGADVGWPALLCSFGVSLVERACMDAIMRRHGVSLSEALLGNLFGIRAGSVHPELEGIAPRDWLPAKPTSRLFARHTVGLGDPLTDGDVSGSQDAPDDGLPHSLESYLARYSQRYFKIKVANNLEDDLARIRDITRLVESFRGRDYVVTLDGNEQYESLDELVELTNRIGSDPTLQGFWTNTLLVEQPIRRDATMGHSLNTIAGVQKPVIIDESDGTLTSFTEAMECGYRGVSSKSCKGPMKSVLNLGVIWNRNRDVPGRYQMTAEDLCCVGAIPLQSDLCLVSALGLTHTERNGHHYHPGLSYLPEDEQARALVRHGDLYTKVGDLVTVRLVDGQLEIPSIHGAVGFGFDPPFMFADNA